MRVATRALRVPAALLKPHLDLTTLHWKEQFYCTLLILLTVRERERTSCTTSLFILSLLLIKIRRNCILISKWTLHLDIKIQWFFFVSLGEILFSYAYYILENRFRILMFRFPLSPYVFTFNTMIKFFTIQFIFVLFNAFHNVRISYGLKLVISHGPCRGQHN